MGQEESKYLTPEETEKVLQDSKARDNARYWANAINVKFRGNWMTIDRIQKKCGLSQLQMALDVMGVLVLFGFCHRETKNGVTKYKITINPEDKIRLLEVQLKEKQKEVADIEKEIERLKAM